MKKKINKPNTLDSNLYVLISVAAILFLLKELFFFVKMHSVINLIMLILLDIAVIGVAAAFFVNRLHINTKEVFGIEYSKRYFGYSIIFFFFMVIITAITIPDTSSNADNSDTTIPHKINNENVENKKENHHSKDKTDEHESKKEEKFDAYKVNVTNISENSTHDYLKVSGTTNAPNGSQIYVSTDNRDEPDTTTDGFNNDDEDDMATVKDNKFNVYIGINYINQDFKYNVGSKLNFLISAFSGIKHNAADDFTDKQISELIDESTTGTYKITQSIHDQFKQSSGNSYSSDDNGSSDKNVNNNSDDNTPSLEQEEALERAEGYADDMHLSKAGIYNQLTSSAEGYSKSAADYAINNLTYVDWNENALETGQEYLQMMNMSKNDLYDQLVSSAGAEFTASQAQYAVDNLY